IKKEISDIVVATAYLGIKQVYRIALSITVVNALNTSDKDVLGRIWFHSYYTALCSKYLGSKFEPLLDPNEIWTAALLHDVGKLIYLKLFPDHYKALEQFCEENDSFFCEAETHYSLPASARFGAFLCDNWRLSEKIKLACSFHNLSDLPKFTGRGASDSFVRMIILGNLLASLSDNILANEKREEILRAIQTSLNISENDVVLLMADIYELKADVECFG
ncbi:MAG: HDOD domain-containing protein, partial [Planctomycetes bacterium]|nr:HDOD domain-containing protein [Planctomycetota bacterium]